MSWYVYLLDLKLKKPTTHPSARSVKRLYNLREPPSWSSKTDKSVLKFPEGGQKLKVGIAKKLLKLSKRLHADKNITYSPLAFLSVPGTQYFLRLHFVKNS